MVFWVGLLVDIVEERRWRFWIRIYWVKKLLINRKYICIFISSMVFIILLLQSVSFKRFGNSSRRSIFLNLFDQLFVCELCGLNLKWRLIIWYRCVECGDIKNIINVCTFCFFLLDVLFRWIFCYYTTYYS